ncbi:hypothetical protein GCM10027053_43200 [Intrasporangium mesophilum]
MTKHVTPWSRGLRVAVPEYPEVETSRDATTAKLARNVAALFGVPVPHAQVSDAPWLCDYNELTIVDIGRGSPPGWAPLDGTRIASATLSKFGPEVKSAIVLTGSNKLFGSLMGPMKEVLEITGLADDGQPLADASRICIWASLQLDAFVAQPALAMAAYQARAIQRAASVRWTPLVDAPAQQPPQSSGRTIEFASKPETAQPAMVGESRADAASLNIVDSLMDKVVSPVAVSTADGLMSSRLLVEETTNRLLSHIANAVADTGFARISAGSRGRRHLDVVVNRTPVLAAYIDANLRLFNDILPFEAPRNHGSEQLDLGLPSHWQRLVPRVPSKFEMLRSSTTVRSATIRSLANLIRALRSMQATIPPDTSIECRKRALGLVQLAAELFGEDHEETLTVRCLYADMLFTALRRGSASEFDAYRDLPSLSQQTVHDCLRLFETSDTWPAGEWLHCLDRISPTLSLAILNLRRVDEDTADRAAAALLEAWHKAFARLGVDVTAGDLVTLRARSNGLASPLHHWLIAATLPGQPFEQIERAIEVGENVVLEHRQQLAEVRRHDRPLRDTLHVLGRAVADALDQWTDPGTRDHYSRLLLDIEGRLVRTSRIKFLLDIDPAAPDFAQEVESLITSDADVLMSLAAVGLRNAELSPSETDTARQDRALALAEAIQTADLGILVDSDLSCRLQQLKKTRDGLRGRALASAR